MKKERYIEVMKSALSAYSDAHIRSYFEDVKKTGITEHGFPRLTANIGILLCRGHRENLLPIFIEMMDFCVAQVSLARTEATRWAGNDFSVKELIFCLLEVEKNSLLPKEKTEAWREGLGKITPECTYSQWAQKPSDVVNNWAVFTATSECMRKFIGLADTTDFCDLQISSQTRYIDPNGMYRDPNEPMVYDLVTRGLFSVMLHFGYDGVYRELLDGALRKAGLLTLRMQSVTGEIPFGGRSAQFPHNEAHMALIFEFEANRYKREGNAALASLFKARAERALENIEYWMNKKPIRHVKNRYPTESGYGCEDYAYFDKYMITVASFIYVAYLFSDDSIEAVDQVRTPAVTFTAEPFHKCFLEAADYFLEIELSAYTHYDEDGLGRIHKRGAPSPICLSSSMTANPNYKVDNARAASMVPGYEKDGEFCLALSGAASYRPFKSEATEDSASVTLLSEFEDRTTLRHSYFVSKDGVDIKVSGAERCTFSFLAFDFDGETKTELSVDEKCVRVVYEGYSCTYCTDGKIVSKDEFADNRNGSYRVFYAVGEKEVSLHVAIEEVKG